MANEISQVIQVKVAKGGATVAFDSRKLFNMTGSNMLQATSLISHTSPSQIDFGAVAGNPRLLIVKNLNTANFVTLAGDNLMSGLTIKIRPDECCLFEPSTSSVFAQADGAPCLIQVIAVEED